MNIEISCWEISCFFDNKPEYFYIELSPLLSAVNNNESPISVAESSENLIVASEQNGKFTLNVCKFLK